MGEVVPATAQVTYAGFWRRGFALLLDSFLLGTTAGFVDMAGSSNVDWLASLLFLGFVVAYVVLLTATGGTPGKRLLGLRVVRADGTPAGVSKALIRELLKPLTVIPFGLGWLWMLDEPMARTWHDLAADTVVVREFRTKRSPVWAAHPPWEVESAGQRMVFSPASVSASSSARSASPEAGAVSEELVASRDEAPADSASDLGLYVEPHHAELDSPAMWEPPASSPPPPPPPAESGDEKS